MKSINLSAHQVNKLINLASEMRRKLGFVGETPIAADIFRILDRINIILLEFPIESESDRPAFSAAMMHLEEGHQTFTFIGLNTADYFDKQIFAIAHELFHYLTKTGSHLSRLDQEESNLIEEKANRFAAELLLPEYAFKNIILEEFEATYLDKIPHKTLLRFIARLHCDWWLPYRSIVKRLHETGTISPRQYEELYAINERDLNGEYGKIGQAINKDVYQKLNQKTYTIGTSPREIEIVIRNFEDDLIDEDKFAETLNLFNKTPAEFGYEIKVSPEDIEELEAFFSEEVDE